MKVDGSGNWIPKMLTWEFFVRSDKQIKDLTKEEVFEILQDPKITTRIHYALEYQLMVKKGL